MLTPAPPSYGTPLGVTVERGAHSLQQHPTPIGLGEQVHAGLQPPLMRDRVLGVAGSVEYPEPRPQPQSLARKFAAVLVDGPPRGIGDRFKVTDQGFDLKGATVLWDDIDQPIMKDWLESFCTSNGMTSELVEHVSKPYAVAA